MHMIRAFFVTACLSLISSAALASVDDTEIGTDGNYPAGGHSCDSDLYSVSIQSDNYGGASVKIQYTKAGTSTTYIDVPSTPTWSSGASNGTLVRWAHPISINVAAATGLTDIDYSIWCASN